MCIDSSVVMVGAMDLVDIYGFIYAMLVVLAVWYGKLASVVGL
jgi:hypothetical protein